MLAYRSGVSVLRLGGAVSWTPLIRTPLQTSRRGISSTLAAAGEQFPQAPSSVNYPVNPITGTSTSTLESAKNNGAGAADNMKAGDVSGPMLEPSVANTSWARSLAILAAIGAAAGASGFLPSKAAAFVHVAAFGTWLGSIIWQTFFVGLLMFKVVPRQTFGKIQSHLFPAYFALTTGTNAILLATLLLGSKTVAVTSQAPVVLGVALVCSLVNWLVVEPITTKLMFERYGLENLAEKTEAVKARIQSLYKQFGKYHGMSSVINLVVMCCAFSHAWYLGSMLA